MATYNSRSSGILLHPTSLPGPEGIGTLGPEALEFVEFLHASGQGLWQTLPLGPTGFADSPYQCFSAFAGNPLIISLERLVEDGLLTDRDVRPGKHANRVDYGTLIGEKRRRLARAYEAFESDANHEQRTAFDTFIERESEWLQDYALFAALKERYRQHPWWQWRRSARLRTHLEELRGDHHASIRAHAFCQYLFFSQWEMVKRCANAFGIRIIGDLPLYIAEDSADLWSDGPVFQVDEHRRPTHVAGVPPDFFVPTGQRWGNPVYDWSHARETEFAWWVRRLRANLKLYDVLRIDHFRGLEAYWSVDAKHATAEQGTWVNAPGEELLEVLQRELGMLPLIAEDLGDITEAVTHMRDTFNIPGMKVLQYAFENDGNNGYLPHHHDRNFVVYTGTHDNDTLTAWRDQLDADSRARVKCYVGSSVDESVWPLIRCAWTSVANMAIAPMQDVLGHGTESRMNLPGTTEGNWRWRCAPDDFSESLSARLHELTAISGRLPLS
ncbi:MAG: 4-alpha-glucanotransferase [Candidatus Promineifilaceae bacterium]|jgi:4-alpha-glucanotransferase